MKRTMKRILCMLACFSLLLGALAFPLGVVAADTSTEVQVNDSTGSRSAVSIGSGYSYRAVMNGSFDAFAFCIVTWKNTDSAATVSLYKWEGTHSKTLRGEPVATKRFDPITDDTDHWVEFDEQPAGEYLFHISDARGQVGVWTWENTTEPHGFLYQNGVEGRGNPELKIRLTESVDAPFGDCVPSAEVRRTMSPETNGKNPTVTNIGSPMGVRLTTAAPFASAEFNMATYKATDMTIHFSIYEWKGSYKATTAADPKVTKKITMVDNSYQGISFDELPAGDYLFLVHDPSGTPAMYVFGEVSSFEGVVYRDGFPMEESEILYPCFRLTFTADLGDDPYFLPCEGDDDNVTGDYVAPPAYTIPEDSLIYTHPVMPDTWVFTDGLGRVSLTNAEVGDRREDKTLAMFFWTWHVDNFASVVPDNLQELSEKYPEAMRDYNHSLWASTSGSFVWNESIYGFYRSDDQWVARKQAELLANAGVDVIFTDNTNNVETWRESYTAIMSAWDDAMNDGVLTPKFSFLLPFSEGENTKQQLTSIYLDVFRSNKWQNLWFYWEDKPMLMAYPGSISADNSNTEKEIANFFTFRPGYASYTSHSAAIGQWGWLSTYPQKAFYAERQDVGKKNIEQMTVGVALNHNYKTNALSAMNGDYTIGRSYTSDYQNRYEVEGAEASKWGYNFAEQFAYAIEQDPKVIFVTGWNEWRVGRHQEFCGVSNAFPDSFNDEFSRDIEPTKGALQDHYYYQLVNFSRQYQGARPIPTPSERQTIDLAAGEEQWKNVAPYYGAYIGNTDDRNAQGCGDLVYTETSGRNDIIGAQVARDDEYVYFHVECAEDITPYTDKLWMNLYIDAAGDGTLDGWNSFDYVVNKSAASENTLVLEKFTGNGYASEKVADVAYTVDGRYMTVKIAKSDLGLAGDDYTVNFAWTDNVHDEGDYNTYSGDIMDFYISGDVAPGGRFKYSFISTAENAGVDASESESDTTPVTEPVTDAATETAEGDKPQKKGGCSSAFAVCVLPILVAAGFCVSKKKD